MAKQQPTPNASTILDEMKSRVLGQEHSLNLITRRVTMYQAGLNPEGRPAGVFLLLGPSGTGKTHTVESLARVLHGGTKHYLRIDCGECQMDHEVARLIGAPPGFIGHKETQPLLTQAKLASITSSTSSLSLVLFDEIEKAAPALQRMLLGVLDKGTLRLGDSNSVNFERSIIFMTSNLGSSSMHEQGISRYQMNGVSQTGDIDARVEQTGLAAFRKFFSSEFVNRIDEVVVYRPLKHFAPILELELIALNEMLTTRLGSRRVFPEFTDSAKRFLIDKGTSTKYGARELKRVISRYVVEPLAQMIVNGEAKPMSVIRVSHREGSDTLSFKPRNGMSIVEAA